MCKHACVCACMCVEMQCVEGLQEARDGKFKDLERLEPQLHHSSEALGKPFSLPEFQSHHPHCDQSVWLGRLNQRIRWACFMVLPRGKCSASVGICY